MINALVAAVLNWLLVKLMWLIGRDVEKKKKEAEIKHAAEADHNKLLKAETPDEKADVAADLAAHTFKQ